MKKIIAAFSLVDLYSLRNKFFNNKVISTLSNRINEISKSIFKLIKIVVTFPLRYLGSKKWSLPGLIFRLPGVVFNRIFRGDQTPLKEKLIQSGYHYHSSGQLTKDELRSHLPLIATMAYVNKCDENFIQSFNYQNVSPDHLIENGLKLPKWIKRDDKFFIDRSTGLKVVILEKEDQIVVTFGAVGSYTLSPEIEKKRMCSLRNYQYFTAHLNLIGFKPAIYGRANQFFKLLQQQLKVKNKPIVITGSCFGGALASYVSLKNQVPAVCINTLQLGGGLQQSIGAKRLRDADKYLTHIKVEGDYLSGGKLRGVFDEIIGFFGIRTPGKFGKKCSIRTYHTDRSKIHSCFISSVLYHLGYKRGTQWSAIQV